MLTAPFAVKSEKNAPTAAWSPETLRAIENQAYATVHPAITL